MSEKITLEGNTNDIEVAEEIKDRATEASHDFINANESTSSIIEPSKEDAEKIEIIKEKIKKHQRDFENKAEDEATVETKAEQGGSKPEDSKENKKETEEGSEGRGLGDSEPGFLKRFWTRTKTEWKLAWEDTKDEAKVTIGVGASIFGWMGKWYNKIKSFMTGKPLPKK